jgi:hypothetical protein
LSVKKLTLDLNLLCSGPWRRREVFAKLLQAVQSRLKGFVILENQAARAI